MSFRNLCTVFRLSDNLFVQTRSFVSFLAECHTFDDVFKVHLTGNFADDYGVERVPFTNYVTLLDCSTVLEVQFRTVRDVRICKNHICMRINDTHFSKTTYNNVASFSLNCTQFVDFEDTVVA